MGKLQLSTQLWFGFSQVPYPLIEHTVREIIKALHSDAFRWFRHGIMGTPKLERNPHGLIHQPSGEVFLWFRWVTYLNKDPGHFQLIIFMIINTINRKLVVTALIQHWWGHWWLMTQITTHTCIPGDSGQSISTIIASTANRHPGSLWCYLHLLKRKLELQEIKFLAHYWLKSEAELGFNPNLLVYNPWIFFLTIPLSN